MDNMTNFVRQAIEDLGLDPDGALIGGIGTIIATIGRVNGVNWKEALLLTVAGLFLCGYVVPALREVTEIGEGLLFFVVFILGVVSQDVYKAIQGLAPALFKVAGEGLKEWIKKKLQ